MKQTITTIQLDSKTKERLDNLKVHPRETYNEIITRLLKGNLKKVDKESLIETIEILSDPQTMREIAEALEGYKEGRFIELK